MRWPRGPGKGGRSSPGSSRPNFTQFTIRAISLLPSASRKWDAAPHFNDPPAKSRVQPSGTVEEGGCGVKRPMVTRAPPVRILFFGMHCIFSPPVLAALVAAGHDIAAVITPGPAG